MMAMPALCTWVIVVLICLTPIAGLWAQDSVPQPSVELREDFSDNELQSFVKANEKMMEIQTKA